MKKNIVVEPILLMHSTGDRFERIKEHMESTRQEVMSDSDVVRMLVILAIDSYKFY